MAKFFKKEKKPKEAREGYFGLRVIDGFKFGFGFFLAFILGWVAVIVIAFILSLISGKPGLGL